MKKMIRVGICEDEVPLLEFFEEVVRKWLTERHIDHEVVAALQGETLLAETQEFDIVFLDVSFANSQMNGIMIGKRLRERSKQTKIIYVTGYPEYRTDAMDVHCFYYLLKPVKAEAICKQLQEAIEYIEAGPVIFPFDTEEGIVQINLEKIHYLFYFTHNRVHIIMKEKTYVVRDTMKNMSKILAAYPFFLIHQAYLVNLFHVRRLYARKVVLLDGTELPVADRRSSRFRKVLYERLYEASRKG